MKRIEDVATFLFVTGLLGEINRTVLHPRGLALAVSHDTVEPGHRIVITISGINLTDDPQGFDFSDEDLASIARKLDAAGLRNPLPRRHEIGFVVQPLPEATGG